MIASQIRAIFTKRQLPAGPFSVKGSGKVYYVPTLCGLWAEISLHSDYVGDGREWIDVHRFFHSFPGQGDVHVLDQFWSDLLRKNLRRFKTELHPFAETDFAAVQAHHEQKRVEDQKRRDDYFAASERLKAERAAAEYEKEMRRPPPKVYLDKRPVRIL